MDRMTLDSTRKINRDQSTANPQLPQIQRGESTQCRISSNANQKENL
jgi:hypothetical protein